MKHVFSVLAVILFGVTVTFAQYTATDLSHSGTYSTADASVTIKGYLIDEDCAFSHLNSLAQEALGHKTCCSLKAPEGALGMVYKGQYVPFDEKGWKKANEVMKKSEKAEGLMVSVTGVVRGNRFAVSRIKEIKSL